MGHKISLVGCNRNFFLKKTEQKILEGTTCTKTNYSRMKFLFQLFIYMCVLAYDVKCISCHEAGAKKKKK